MLGVDPQRVSYWWTHHLVLQSLNAPALAVDGSLSDAEFSGDRESANENSGAVIGLSSASVSPNVHLCARIEPPER